jgi:deoxypyrimidine-specific 5' nucleotidase type C protein (NT5C)
VEGEKVTLVFDIDGVLADFTTAYANLLIKTTGTDKLVDGWKDKLAAREWPTTWYWDREAGYTKEEEVRVWSDYITKQGIFWENLDAIDGAGEIIKYINKLAKKGINIYFITHRMGEKAKLQTEKWLYGLGMDYPTVILSGDKAPLLYSLGANFFIDDKPETIMDICDKMVADRMRHNNLGGWPLENGLYLKDAAYNRGIERVGFKRVGSVKEALMDMGVWE